MVTELGTADAVLGIDDYKVETEVTHGHPTIDIEINALPDREGLRAREVERFALDMPNFVAASMKANAVEGSVGA